MELHLPTVGQAPVRHAVQNFAGVMGFVPKPYFSAKPGADTPPVVDFNKKP